MKTLECDYNQLGPEGEPCAMKFLYYQAGDDGVSGLLEDDCECSLCGKVGQCFQLGDSICPSLTEAEQEVGAGCYECLRSGRFEFRHYTEAGWLDEGGLERSDDAPTERVYAVDPSGVVVEVSERPKTPLVGEKGTSPKVGIPHKALVELRRTPDWISWQGSHWFCHCNDFMVYLGEWETQDFNNAAPDGNGRALFLEMTDPDQHFAWEQGEELFHNIAYYAMQCRHCGKLRGYWDSG